MLSLFNLIENLLKVVWHALVLVLEGLVAFLLVLFTVLLVIAIAVSPKGWLFYFGGRTLERYLKKQKGRK